MFLMKKACASVDGWGENKGFLQKYLLFTGPFRYSNTFVPAVSPTFIDRTFFTWHVICLVVSRGRTFQRIEGGS